LVAGSIVLAKPFLSIFLGEKWVAAALPMQILTLAIGINIITSISLSLFNAMGKTVFNFKVNCIKLATLCVFAFPLIRHYGVTGASLCYLGLSLSAFILWKLEIYKLLKLTMKELYFLGFPIINTVPFVIILLCFDSMIPIVDVSTFLGAVFLGGIVYFSTGLIIEKLTGSGPFKDLVEIIHLLKPTKKISKEHI